jgi:hypothetical protein
MRLDYVLRIRISLWIQSFNAIGMAYVLAPIENSSIPTICCNSWREMHILVVKGRFFSCQYFQDCNQNDFIYASIAMSRSGRIATDAWNGQVFP